MVAEVMRLECRTNLVQDRNTLKRQEAADRLPADFFRGKTAVARLAPDDLGMPVDGGRHLLDRQQVWQLQRQRDRRLCDATLHCSLQRRKVHLPTSYCQWKASRSDQCRNAGPS